MSPLDRKLLRDLWRMRGQAIAIALVMATGVLLQVMMTGLVSSLEETRRAYYERYRLADVFAPVARAPDRLVDRLANIPGVASVEGRVTGSALIDIPGIDLPLFAQAVSLPDTGDPKLNGIYLTEGRTLSRGRTDEVIVLQSFARAHGLGPGDRLRATMNGARRSFQIVGLAQAPEFLYTAAPGELVPDDSRFGVLWMGREALGAAYDMDGAFNEALVSLSRNASEDAVLAAADRVLAPYGGLGAFPLADQFSNQFIAEEISGLQASSRSVPPIFLAVAAFLLYIVIGRMVQAEREEIGLMKAFGYSNFEVGGHYFKFVITIATGGAILGGILGTMAGRAMVEIYVKYYKFPFLVFQLELDSFISGTAVSILAASAGGLFVLGRVFRLAPAEAMRPPAPPDYSRTGRIGQSFNRFLDQPSRMVLRRITRQPWRIAGSIAGIAAGMSLAVAMVTINRGFDTALSMTFSVVDRSDVTVTFTHAVSDKTIYELARLPGVVEVEPVRFVPVVLSHGLNTHRGALSGLIDDNRLFRAVDDRAAPIPMREDGVILATTLAKKLEARPGDMLSVEVREGHQPVLSLQVAGIADSLLGAPAYMEMTALNRALREPHRVSGAYLRVDAAEQDRVYRALKNMPTVAGVTVKLDTLSAFRKIMDSGAGAVRFIMGAIAFVITFGIIYNAATIAYAERSRDLASLRVIGFTRREAGFVLLGELGVVTLLALPLGCVSGFYLTYAVAEAFGTDLYQIPVVFSPESIGSASLFVLAAAAASGILVQRQLNRADLVSALKTRE